MQMDILKVPRHLELKDRMMRMMLYTLFIVIVADGLITQFLVSGGQGLEANPFLQAWVSQNIFLAIKISGAFLISLFLWVKYNSKPKLIYSITAVFLAVYTGIVLWNLLVYLVS